MRKLARRHRGVVLAASAAILALMGGTIGTTWGLVQARKAEKLALEERDQKTLALAAEAAQRKEADAQRIRAGEEAATALSVLQFVQNDLLRQADPNWQVLLTQDTEPNLTVRAALDRSAATVERRFRDKPLAEAAIRRTMGVAYEGLGDISKAVYHLTRAVELFVKHAGTDDERTISAQFSLAVAYRRTVKVADSIPLFEKVYNWRRKNLGGDHWDTITTANSLSFVYIDVGRLDDAEDLLAEVADHQRHLGQDTYVSLATLNAAAYLQAKRGRWDEAIRQLEELIQRWDAAFGAETPHKFDPLNNLGQLYQRVGRFEDAVQVFKDALDRGQQTWPAEHPKLMLLTGFLVDTYWESGEVDDAVKLQEEFRQKLTKRLGPNHLRVHLATHELARLYAETGETTKAEEMLRSSLDLLGPAGSQAAMTRAVLQATLARTLYLTGKLEEGELIGREALATLSSRRPDDWPVYDLQMVIGLILAKKGQTEEARQMLTEARGAVEKRKAGLPYPARRRLIEVDAILATLPIQS
jgi:tetratricopeptide (TPR) repeat protein